MCKFILAAMMMASTMAYADDGDAGTWPEGSISPAVYHKMVQELAGMTTVIFRDAEGVARSHIGEDSMATMLSFGGSDGHEARWFIKAGKCFENYSYNLGNVSPGSRYKKSQAMGVKLYTDIANAYFEMGHAFNELNISVDASNRTAEMSAMQHLSKAIDKMMALKVKLHRFGAQMDREEGNETSDLHLDQI